MPRSGVEARRRLREAALELYRDCGYDATTTAQIAARAGVTERTYFRHFADKREVLFDGEPELLERMTAAVASAPAGLTALDYVVRAYRGAVPMLVTGRSEAQRRSEVLTRTPALQERAHTKAATLLDGITAAVSARGIPVPAARLAASIGAAAFELAARTWTSGRAADLHDLITGAIDEVRKVTAPAAGPPASGSDQRHAH